jgi:hypothetical protein
MHDLGFMVFKIILLFIIILSFSGCWEKNYDYVYQIAAFNQTNDTILMQLGSKYTVNDYDKNIIDTLYPDDTSFFYGSKPIEEGLDVVKLIFNESVWDTCYLYKNDSLLKYWDGPAREMPDSLNHFFNYNSWSVWLIDNDEGIVMFTIYESDLNSPT